MIYVRSSEIWSNIKNAHILNARPIYRVTVQVYRFTLVANNDTVFYFITKKLYRFFYAHNTGRYTYLYVIPGQCCVFLITRRQWYFLPPLFPPPNHPMTSKNIRKVVPACASRNIFHIWLDATESAVVYFYNHYWFYSLAVPVCTHCMWF